MVAGCGASGGDAVRGPERVRFGEEAGDLAPAGSFAGLARFADEDNEEIETVARGTDTAVRGRADKVAKGGQELEQDGGRVGFGVRGEAINNATRDAVESRGGSAVGARGGWRRGRWLGIFIRVRVIGVRGLEVLRFFLVFRKGRDSSGRYAWSSARSSSAAVVGSAVSWRTW